MGRQRRNAAERQLILEHLMARPVNLQPPAEIPGHVMFGKYVADKLRTYPIRRRTIVESEILQVLVRHEEEMALDD